MTNAMSIAATPPTTPPAIAPVFEEEPLGSGDGSDDDDDGKVSPAETTANNSAPRGARAGQHARKGATVRPQSTSFERQVPFRRTAKPEGSGRDMGGCRGQDDSKDGDRSVDSMLRLDDSSPRSRWSYKRLHSARNMEYQIGWHVTGDYIK
ncbi:MAG: hypothetical protein Q9173_002437 [Seirophora scorigena]